MDLWLKDEKRLEYERMDFIPNVENCPSTVFNLFKGFKAEKYRPEQAITEVDIQIKIVNIFFIIFIIYCIINAYCNYYYNNTNCKHNTK